MTETLRNAAGKPAPVLIKRDSGWSAQWAQSALRKNTEMHTSEFLLGDRLLHQRLVLATAILGKFVWHGNAAYTTDYLAQEFGCSIELIHGLCTILNRYGFIAKRHKDEATEPWSLCCHLAALNLGDVFVAVLESPCWVEDKVMPDFGKTENTRNAELLLSQVALDLNVVIHRYLRQFCFLSLKAPTSGSFNPANLRAFA